MANDPIVFAMANPIPEIMPEEAKKGGARIIATGRSDYPNQINNVLVFPGIFKGALMVEAKQIVEEMKIAAAEAISSLISPEELDEEYIIPDVLISGLRKRLLVKLQKLRKNWESPVNHAQNNFAFKKYILGRNNAINFIKTRSISSRYIKCN